MTVRITLCAMAVLLALMDGCGSRLNLPDMGPPIPYNARIEFTPALKNAKSQYTDSCGHLFDVRYGDVLQDSLLQTAYRLFKSVSWEEGGSKDVKPDVVIQVDLVYSSFSLKQDNLYDRVPATLKLSGVAKIQDQSGKVLREPEIQVEREERVRVEAVQKNCNYILDPMVNNAAIEFSMKFAQEARQALAPGSQPVAAATPATSAPTAVPQTSARSQGGGAPPGGASGGISFKATVLDDNGNSVLESGERVKLRVDLVNAGVAVARDVAVTLTGTPALVTQFPATTLPVGTLMPGESRAVEFAATVPVTFPGQQAELVVSVSESTGFPLLRPKTLEVAVRAMGSGMGAVVGSSADSVDQIPAAPLGFQRSNAYLLAIGAGTVRDQQRPVRKYAARDAELVGGYFRTLGGFPADNVRVLKDREASLADIEEALLDWLPARAGTDSLVIVYFSGQAVVSASGAASLVLYEGGRAPAKGYLLRDIQAALAKLKARTTMLIIDGSIAKSPAEAKAKFKPPQWEAGGTGIVRLIGSTGFASGLEPERLGHGLFTYYLLKGIRGEADANRDGDILLGELTAFLHEAVPSAARSEYSQEQQPMIQPQIAAGTNLSATLLTKTASMAGR